MASTALAEFADAVREVNALLQANPMPRGVTPTRLEAGRAIGRAAIVLLSGHFERYIRRCNEDAVTACLAGGVTTERCPEVMRLLHARSAVDELAATDWENRADALRRFVSSEAELWRTGAMLTALDHRRLLMWMKTPRPREIQRYYRLWGVEDIFSAVTRNASGRTRLWIRLDALVVIRNNIAHGDPAATATFGDIREYKRAALDFCTRADRRLARAVAQTMRIAAPW